MNSQDIARRIAAQRGALRTLNELWELGAAAGLAPLVWRMGTDGISGTAVDGDDDAQLTAIRSWAALLHVTLRELPNRPGDELTTHTGTGHEGAVFLTLYVNVGVGRPAAESL